MPYTPPSGNAVNFAIDAYTSIPAGNAVNFDLSVGAAYSQTLTETLTLVDNIERAITKNLTEVVTLVDTIVKSLSRTLTDAITLEDLFTGTKTLGTVVLTESITLADNIVKSLSRTLTTETITLAETFTRGIGKNLSESITLQEIFTKAVVYVRKPLILATFVLKPLLSSLNFMSKSSSTNQKPQTSTNDEIVN